MDVLSSARTWLTTEPHNFKCFVGDEVDVYDSHADPDQLKSSERPRRGASWN